MKRILSYTFKGILGVGLLLGSASALYAQNERDAQNLTERTLNGTARSMSMGGAVGALGADPSAIRINPAGVNFYTSHAMHGTFGLGWLNTSTEWGMNTKTGISASHRLGALNNFTIVLPSRRIGSGVNLSFSYNRDKEFGRAYRMEADGMPVSIADYAARMAYRIPPAAIQHTKTNNPYNSGYEWLPVFAENAGLIEHLEGTERYRSTFVYNNYSSAPDHSTLKVEERGANRSFDFSLGISPGDYLHLGAMVTLHSVNYTKRTYYGEAFDSDGFYKANYPDYNGASSNDYLEIVNNLNTSGQGVSATFGALISLGEFGRIGVSYLTPQFLTLKDEYIAEARSFNWRYDKDKGPFSYNTPKDYYTQYYLVKPGVLTASALVYLGGYGILTYDFDYSNAGGTRLKFDNGTENSNNVYIREYYGNVMSHRFGLELKPTQQFSIRAGVAQYSNPIKDIDVLGEDESGLKEDVGTSGTMSDFILTKGKNSYYTLGIGYTFKGGISLDLAYVNNTRSAKAYPFSSSSYKVGNDIYTFPSKGGDLKQASHQILIGFTYRY
ncbi:MAG: hypothetical protein Q3998_02065 [Porphyromonas sp.]|nr:hypothetical protein [Porphyromonas sp.]